MGYTKEDIHNIAQAQREFFLSGKTLDVKFRIAQLKKLKRDYYEDYFTTPREEYSILKDLVSMNTIKDKENQEIISYI